MTGPGRRGRRGPGRSARAGGSAAARFLVLLAVAGCGAAPGTGPGVDGGVRPALPRVVVEADSTASAVAVALAFPGSAWELPGTEGLTLLAAETLLEQARWSLDALGAKAAVTCERALFTFTLVAPRETWGIATDVLLSALFHPAPQPWALDRARARLGRALALDQASPAWQGHLAARQALHGDTARATPWDGPPCGVPETLALFDTAHVRAASHRFAARMAHGAIVGVRDAAAARERVRRWLPPESPPSLPAPAIVRPGTRHVERNTVTAWTARAWPFRPDADREALLFLAAVLEDALGPHVSRPAVFSMSHELELHGAGGALILHAVTAPRAAPGLSAALLEAVREIARDGVSPAVWERVARRHRGVRLLEGEAPEARAAALARGLAAGSPEPSAWPAVEAVTPARVQAAARSLGAPARAVVGPRSSWGPGSP